MDYILDTHILVWRCLKPVKLVTPKVDSLFLDESNHFLLPCISLLEVQYLHEIGRIDLHVDDILKMVNEGNQFVILPYDVSVMLHSLKLTSTRDPFDRIILAHALATSTQIITKDHWMKKEAPKLVVF